MAIIFFFDIYFLPKQSEFYTRQDIDKLKDSKFYLILLLEILFFGIPLLPHFLSKRKIKDFIYSTAFFGMILFFFFPAFQSVTTSIYLFLNRQKSTSETTSKYRIISKNEEEKQYYLTWLFDYELDEIITKNIEIDYSDFIRLKENDTIKVKFKKGWFGIKHTPEFVN